MENLLFVCHGNICRSPMAAHLAGQLLPEVNVESAGLAPAYTQAAAEAIDIMSGDFEIDISGHQPRAIADIELEKFDRIVALAVDAYTSILTTDPGLADRLVLWPIEDPWGRGADAFRSCAADLIRRIEVMIEQEIGDVEEGS